MGVRIHAPEFTGATGWLNVDQPLQMAALRGQVVILDFWTSCCINCMHVLPVLRDLEERHAADPVVVIGVHSAKFSGERDAQHILDAMGRYGVAHPVVVDGDFEVWKRYAVRSWPTLIVVRPDGTIAAIAPGEPDPAVLEGFVQKELAAARENGTLAAAPLHLNRARQADAGPLWYPGHVRAADGRIFVSDSGHHRVLVLDGSGSVVDTIGSGLRGQHAGTFEECVLDDPQGLAVQGDTLFIADARAHVIWRADLQARTLTRLAGTGELGRDPLRGRHGLEGFALRSPWGLALHGQQLYVALAGSHQLAAIDLTEQTIRLVAGSSREAADDGVGAEAALAQPSGLAIANGVLWFADSESSGVRGLDLATERVFTLAGGPGLFDFGDKVGAIQEGMLQHPLDIAPSAKGLLVADTYNDKVKRFAPDGKSLEPLFAGTGALALSQPASVTTLPDGDVLVADTNHHRLIRIRADGSAEPFAIRGAPAPKSGVWSGNAKPMRPASAAGWFSAILEAPAGVGLAPGKGTLVLEIRAPERFELNAEAPFSAALEVSRRSDLLRLASDTVQGTTAGGTAHRLELPYEAVHAGDVDSELLLTLRTVVCDAVDHAACYPVSNAFRIPLRLLAQGQREVKYELPLEVQAS